MDEWMKWKDGWINKWMNEIRWMNDAESVDLDNIKDFTRIRSNS